MVDARGASSNDGKDVMLSRRTCCWMAGWLGLLTCGGADWPQFRGPNAAGFSDQASPPVQWSATENIAWQIDVPGVGWSSPIVAGNRVFLTTVVAEAPPREPRKGLYIENLQGTKPETPHRWLVRCLDLKSGRLLWEREAHRGVPSSTVHLKNSYASETPVTDGERVYAYFGNVGVFCYDVAGTPLWSRPMTPHATRLGWGTAASPVLHDGRLFIVCDNEEESYLAAYDAASGNALWRVTRDERSNWATPFVWSNGLRTELVVPATGKVRSYDPDDGRVLWEFGGMSKTTIPTPTAAHDMLYVSSGYVGDKVRPIFAVRPGASGDITLREDQATNEFVAWRLPQAGPYHPSPLVVGDYLYVLYDRGMLACYEAISGREVYGRRRLGPAAFTASPWYARGKVFCLSEDGETVVVEAGPEFRILDTNSLGTEEMALATPAISGNRLLIRTLSKLYCLADGTVGQTIR